MLAACVRERRSFASTRRACARSAHAKLAQRKRTRRACASAGPFAPTRRACARSAHAKRA
eukprot:3687730-Pleurochrysis_carterae.AAC.1